MREGYKIPLTSYPPKSRLPHNKSAREAENLDFLDSDIELLEAIGAIKEVLEEPWLCLPLQVSSPEGRKKRTIMDASRSLNKFVREKKVKLDHLAKVLEMLPEDVWFCVSDIMAGYYHIAVHEDHQTLLGFFWRFRSGREGFFVWKVSFLGISDMVHHFTKVIAPIKHYLIKKGVMCFSYIDDFLIVGRTEKECHRNRALFRDTLRRSGFIESLPKALEPTQVGQFLGLKIDTKQRLVFIPDDKLARIVRTLDGLIARKRVVVREVSKAVGLVISCMLAVGPTLLLLCRGVYQWISEAESFDVSKDLEAIRGDLRYIRDVIPSIHGYPFTVKELVQSFSVVFASDASGVARAVVCVTCSKDGDHQDHSGPCGTPVFVKEFTKEEAKLSSAWRELVALCDLYAEMGEKWKGRSILHLTDSSCVEAIMKKGSPKPYLQMLALKIYKACRKYKIVLSVQWRSRNDPRLQLADEFSRPDIDIDDWSICQESFNMLQKKLGKCDVDLFANEENARVDKFYSLMPSLKAEGINAFAADWGKYKMGFACPPPKSVKAVIKQVAAQEACVLLVIPKWRSLSAWPLLAEDGVHYNQIVRGMIEFWPYLKKGPHVTSSTFSGGTPFPFVGMVLKGASGADLFKSRITRQFCAFDGCYKCAKK